MNEYIQWLEKKQFDCVHCQCAFCNGDPEDSCMYLNSLLMVDKYLKEVRSNDVSM